MQGNVYGLIGIEDVPAIFDYDQGDLVAEYEYDPFGKLIRGSGTRKDSMSLLYSTKYTDMETGLIYYGHRYYDPNQGRFINRDPIGEAGGINLYGMVRNNLVNAVDFLGLNLTDLINSDISSTDEEEFVIEDEYDDGYDQWMDMLEEEFMRNLEPDYEDVIEDDPIDYVVDDSVVGDSPYLEDRKDWKPTKENCDKLRSDHPEAFTAPNTQNSSYHDAVVAGTFAVGALTNSTGEEHHTWFRKDANDKWYYTTPVSIGTTGGTVPDDTPPWNGGAHGHNMGRRAEAKGVKRT
jgi:RHS repeat-associated protein